MTATLPTTTTPLLSPGYRWATIGMTSLVFLAAFESLAVTTVMATVTRDLDGVAWYSVAFSATLAAGVVGTVAGGLWADRSGAVRPLLAAVVVFVVGLLLAGAAPGIEVFVAARFLQGLGGGAMTVALYVLVAQVFAPVDRPRIFGAFAAAWILPSLVGPPIAGVLADTVGWRWVFWGVVLLCGAATVALVPAMRDARGSTEPVAGGDGVRRLLLAAAAAAAIVTVDLTGRLGTGLGAGLALVGVVVTLVAVRPLLPAGTLRAGRGLPSVVLLRGLLAATFFAAEVHVPYLLQERHDYSPALAGLALTVGSLGWAAASHVQGRMGERLDDPGAMRAGTWLLLAGVGGQLAVAGLHLPGWVAPVLWVAAGAGMGLAFPRVSSFVLAVSAEHERGSNSAAMAIGDAVGGAVTIAVAGLAFNAVGGQSWTAFTAVFALATATAALAVAVARRTGVDAVVNDR